VARVARTSAFIAGGSSGVGRAGASYLVTLRHNSHAECSSRIRLASFRFGPKTEENRILDARWSIQPAAVLIRTYFRGIGPNLGIAAANAILW